MKLAFILLFGGLTLAAVYMTYKDVGAGEPQLSPHSVRGGSVGNPRYYGK